MDNMTSLYQLNLAFSQPALGVGASLNFVLLNEPDYWAGHVNSWRPLHVNLLELKLCKGQKGRYVMHKRRLRLRLKDRRHWVYKVIRQDGVRYATGG